MCETCRVTVRMLVFVRLNRRMEELGLKQALVTRAKFGLMAVMGASSDLPAGLTEKDIKINDRTSYAVLKRVCTTVESALTLTGMTHIRQVWIVIDINGITY